MAEKNFEPTCCRSILSWKLCRKKVNVEVVILLRQWHKVCLATWQSGISPLGQLSQIEGKFSEGRYLVNNHRSTPNTLDTIEHPAFRTNSEDGTRWCACCAPIIAVCSARVIIAPYLSLFMSWSATLSLVIGVSLEILVLVLVAIRALTFPWILSRNSLY